MRDHKFQHLFDAASVVTPTVIDHDAATHISRAAAKRVRKGLRLSRIADNGGFVS